MRISIPSDILPFRTAIAGLWMPVPIPCSFLHRHYSFTVINHELAESIVRMTATSLFIEEAYLDAGSADLYFA